MRVGIMEPEGILKGATNIDRKRRMQKMTKRTDLELLKIFFIQTLNTGEDERASWALFSVTFQQTNFIII